MTPTEYQDAADRYRAEARPALEALIEEQLRDRAWPNAVAMVAVTVGALLLNLGILWIVTGG
jgi:hypothetical protein